MVSKQIIIGMCFLADMLATFFYIRGLRKKFPKIDFRYFEYNSIVAWCWTKFGFYNGSIIAPILMSPFWFVIIYLSMYNPYFFYVLIGAYSIIGVIHFVNLTGLKSEKDSPIGQLYRKVYGGKDGNV